MLEIIILGSNQNISYNIYVDNLSVEPVLTYSNDFIVNSVVYNMVYQV